MIPQRAIVTPPKSPAHPTNEGLTRPSWKGPTKPPGPHLLRVDPVASATASKLLPVGAPAPYRITTRRPRTSLIDAEWDWLARNLDNLAARDPAYQQLIGTHDAAPDHSPTLPPPLFTPDFHSPPANENYRPATSTSASARPRQNQTSGTPRPTSRGSAARRALVIAMSTLASLAVGVTLLLRGGASLMASLQDQSPTSYEVRIQAPVASPPPPTTPLPAPATESTTEPEQAATAAATALSAPPKERPTTAEGHAAKPRKPRPAWTTRRPRTKPRGMSSKSDNPY